MDLGKDMHLEGQLEFSIGQTSKAGVKDINEDCIGIRIPDGALLATKGAVAVIADGVSAAEAGKEASETCVQNFLSDYFSTPDSWSVKKSAHQVLTALNRWLCGQGQRFTDARKGYVSTFSAVVFKSRTAHIFHVGDSRVYRLRDGEFEQLTNDHATVISDKQSYLTRAMGLDVRLEVDYRCVDVEVGDLFLMSTDGVHDFIPAQVLKSSVIKFSGQDYQCLSDELIRVALENKSNDNVSCQILRIDTLPLANAQDVYTKLTELPFPPDLKKGMSLDGYRIEKLIHDSARSQIYLVFDPDSGERYAMKTPSVNFEDDPSYIERFIMESWIGHRVRNSHVVKVVEPKAKRSCLYYLTEFVDGLTLTHWMKENPKASVEDVLYLVDQIAKGIRAFHRRETLHQDIKPDNILIDKNGIVKIVDFGSCFVAGIAEISVPIMRDTALGTETYSAPEYTLHNKPETQADQFSLAVIVYEMLTAQQPYQNKLADCKKLKQFQNLKYIPSFEHNPLVPMWLDGALKKSLSVSPEERYCDVSEFLHDLQYPNPLFNTQFSRPLIERNPLLFWQALCVVLLLAEVFTLALLL